ncbi:MAG: PAS domain-containing protein [Azonexus sp.]|nr:PAS domain-containing protein [Azonexus sp.]
MTFPPELPDTDQSGAALSSPGGHLEGVDESTWMDVVHKMDEVYSQLIADEIELEKKNTELEQSQQFVLSVMSAMSDVLVVCDEQGRIEQANVALCDLVGQSDKALRGTPFAALMADAGSAARLQQVLTNAAPPRSGEGLDLNLLDAEGHAVPVDANATPRLVASGRRQGTVFVGRPTAELKRAYQALQSTHDALKQAQQQLIQSEKMASLGRLVAGVAHELNNPISFVMGNVHALNRYLTRLSEYLAAVHEGAAADTVGELRQRLRIDHLLADIPSLIEGTLEGANRTTDIVNGLKRFSATDKEARAAVDLNEVIERAILWVRKSVGADFTVHWERGEPVMVSGSEGQLQQVLMNLLQNALDAALGYAEQPAVWIAVERDRQWLRLSLRDNGPGIAAKHQSAIFDPFFTTKPVGKGTGLGLSISYGIVEQHGGRLRAANAPAGGAEFTLELPLPPPPI